MAETFGFYDTEELVDGTYDREYVAQQWADYFKLFIGTGVFASPTNQLKVVAGRGMNVVVKAGWAFIEGRWYHNDADLVLPVQPNTTASTITSGVFIQANSSDRVIKAIIATGRTTPDREAPFYELELAQIQLATGTTSITDSMITDMRPDESVCGFVKGLLEGVIPTADLFLQFRTSFVEWLSAQDSEFEQWYSENTSAFNTWFNNIKGQLSTDAAGHLQDEIDVIRPRVTTNLLNPSLFTIASPYRGHGITITNNGDGTFTVDGTTDNNVGSDGRIAVNITTWGANTEIVTGYNQIKLCGTPSSVNQKGMLQLADYNSDNDTQWRSDLGSGIVINTVDNKIKMYALRFEFLPNTTFNNAVFKPMLTTDLQAIYDDYVQYSGDGNLNQNVADLYSIRHRTITNLLNSELDTTTLNGITCTANDDGTYTLNGTATSNTNLVLRKYIKLKENVKYKVEGCPKGGGGSTYKIGLYGQKTATSFDGQLACSPQVGNTIETFKPNNTLYPYGYGIQIVVYKGTTVNNLVFKPMLTTDLTATYDDYVQYSGNGELNENVARNSKQLTLTKDSIAPTEENSFVVDDHYQGEYFYVAEEEKLYRALVDISADDSIDEGSNVEEVTIGAELSSLFGITGRTNSQLLASDGQKFQFAKSGTKYGYKINGVFYPFDKVQASKAVTASTSTQTVTPDSGYDGLGSVTVNAISPQRNPTTPNQATLSGYNATGAYVWFPYGWWPAQDANHGSYVYMTQAQAQAAHQHTSTRASVTANGTIDLGATHNIRYVPVNVPTSPAGYAYSWMLRGTAGQGYSNCTQMTAINGELEGISIKANVTGKYWDNVSGSERTVNAGDTIVSTAVPGYGSFTFIMAFYLG